MDVRCEKCMTVYEFDDSQVGENGVTVKCTQCGNLFKVKRRSTTAELPLSSLGSARSPSYVPPSPSGPHPVGRSTQRGVPVLSSTTPVPSTPRATPQPPPSSRPTPPPAAPPPPPPVA